MRYLWILFALIVVACNHDSDSMTRYHEDGRAKPVVAIASMIDTTSFDAPWSLSEELTAMILQHLGNRGEIYAILKEDDSSTENPFSQDLSWIKQNFADQEFVVFLELVEHQTAPAAKPKRNLPAHEISNNLNMAVRLRVVDLRSDPPRIVLQEMIRDSYFIPKTLLPADYTATGWGTEEYLKTPMGIAHSQLVQEIAARITDYILLAKSR